MTKIVQPNRSALNRKRSKKKKASLSTGSLKGLLIVGSAAATYFGANILAQVDMMQTDTAVEPAPIIISQPTIVDPVQSGDSPIIINTDPIPQVVIPEPVTSSRSSR